MMRLQIKQKLDWLQTENYKPFYLAFLRVAISGWLLKELYINWSSMDLLYGQTIFIESEKRIIKLLSFGNSFDFRAHYRWFIFFYIGVIVLNILGIGRTFTAILLFLSVYIVQKLNKTVLNGGDIFAGFILFYLILSDSYRYFTLFKPAAPPKEKTKFLNLLSNLAAFSIMLQLCMGYFALGVTKLIDPVWQSGEATYYALMNEGYKGTPYNQWIVQHKWIDYCTNYGVMAFELLFPLLVWFKKLRKPFLIAGILFHLSIYIFMMIYGFEVVFMLIYGLFLPNDQLIKFAQKINCFFSSGQGTINRYIGLANNPKTVQDQK